MPTRYHVGTSTPASDNAAGIMASLATLFAVTQDVDIAGAPGVVSAMTWTRDTTAGSQAIYSSAFGPRNCRIIIAVHDSGTPSPSPTMVASADTYTVANILIGLCDDAAGAYAGWNQAAPFTGCTFAGFYRLGPSAGASTGGGIRAWVSTKDLWIQYRSTTSVVQAACAGAVVTGATGYQESDGYRYGLAVSGVGDMSNIWRSNANTIAGFFGRNGTTNGRAHFGLYAVGGTSWQTVHMEHLRVAAATVDMGKWASSGPVAARTGVSIQRSASPENSVGSWSGVSDGPAAQTASIVNDSGAALWGWVFGSQPSGAGEDSIVIARVY
jgi:hypothetical protein